MKPYNYQTTDIFRNLNGLQIDKLYKYSLGKLFYKCKNCQCPDSLKDFFISNNSVHAYNTRNANMPHLYVRRTNYYNNSFMSNAPKMWYLLNNDPTRANILVCNSLGLFSKRLKKYLLNLD